MFVLSRPLKTLERDQFKQKWGVIYEDYKFSERSKIYHKLLFCIRRILFVSSFVVFDTLPTFQLVVLLETNLLMSVYLGFKPFKHMLNNRIEMMNEFFMSSVCYSSIVLTDYLRSNSIKYKGAWFMISIISLTLFINISMVVWFMFGNLKLIATKWYRRSKAFSENKF